MRSVAIRPCPAPTRAGYANRRAAYAEQELTVQLFGGAREVQAAVNYYAWWVSTGSSIYPSRVPEVQVRGVWALPSGACLLRAVSRAQRESLAERIAQILFHQGEH